MAAGTSYMTFALTNGQTLSVLIGTSAAIGTNPYVNMEGTAAATNTQDFQVRSACCIRDQINVVGTAATVSAGQCEFYNVDKGVRTGRFVSNIGADYAVTVAQRNIPKICFAPGTTYRLIQSIAQVSA
jgi:hypothetical protein